jgi:nitrogenase molybdenum-iron protein alpha chain
MSILEHRQPPKREERHGTCTAFGGGLCGLKKEFGGGCSLVDNDRAFRQGSICQMIPALSILSTLPDTVVLVHGAIGCGGAAHNYNASMRSRQMGDVSNPAGTLWISTALGERDVVAGGEGKLRDAILDADRRYRPSAIVIVNTCTPSVIGDDIDGVVDAVQDSVSATVVPVHCEGIRTKVMATAYDAVYHGIAKHLIETPHDLEIPTVDGEIAEAAERIRRAKLVNLFNVSSMGDLDEDELARLLRSIGLEVNIFPCYAHPENMKYATEAALSVSTCPTHDDYFVEFLREAYDVPYLLQHMPIGIGQTSDWLRGVAKHFDLEEIAERLIEREEAELSAALEPLRAKLAGKTAIVSAGEVRTLSVGLLLKELGMRVIAVRPYHYDQFGDEAAGRLTKLEPDVTVNVATNMPYESANLIAEERPDIWIGHNADNVWAAKHGVPALPIYGGNNTYMGYAGVFDFARRLVRQLLNPSFNRHLGENTETPYDPAWFETDAFALIDQGSC